MREQGDVLEIVRPGGAGDQQLDTGDAHGASRLHQPAQELTLLLAQSGAKEVSELLQAGTVTQAPGDRLGVALRGRSEGERAGVLVNAEREGGRL